ncbi:MAG: hypothetical protein KDF54_14105 [Hydrogenophaga sp.]|nr:hypothetical protein [Hydrogenophaga sp.]
MKVIVCQGSFGALPVFPEPLHQWTLPDGTLWLQFARCGERHWLRFPGLADFMVSPDGLTVEQCAAPGTDDSTLEHLLLNQVFPLAQSLQGSLVFHASAVALDSGAAAFLGHSGWGKSTLAASFASAGSAFLTDDGLQLDERAGAYWVQPSHPSIRLWNDSREALIHDEAQLSSPVQYTSKSRVLSDDLIAACREPMRLRRVYFLGDGEVDGVEIQSISPREALIGLVNHSFMLDTSTAQVMARHFDALSRMVSLPIFFRLDYPRRYDLLAQVRMAVQQHSAQEGPSP